MPVSQTSSRTSTPHNGDRAMQMDDESTPARAPMDPAMSKYHIVWDKTIYDSNYYIVDILVDKLYAQTADDPIDIKAFHKLRKEVHEQQPKRLVSIIDEWLVELYNKAMKNCDKSDHDECIAISGCMNELTLIRCHEGVKASKPELNKLLKMNVFLKWPIGKQISMADCRDTIQFVSVAKDLFADTYMPLIQYLSLVQELLRQTDATEVSRTALNNIRSTKQLWQDFTDVEDYNILIVDNLRRTPVDYLLEKWLNDFYDTRMKVEVRVARLRRTMFELEKRYKGTEREAINWQLLKAPRYQVLAMYGLQAETDKIIKAQTKPDGSSGHLSDISEKGFHPEGEEYQEVEAHQGVEVHQEGKAEVVP
ncbi:hypothetical protein SARC_05930 [Sphaeroforma arctica JP610]|uniref:Uncharacterized protein n=1 Tax=Sphaeroforma arctica JP610 TaxID=667725 RepID=A0A0L0FY50_9EUKA|nr:hypothetical protein SARC_05930 [Sphaeroforma arctica JP610]KNC81760.1 hypothetical protein SARC_05930 [Sphaeroforma arctica JP610]|eukprot:XP_014155662.1 hypothetical protein SARC_05930 [Sphaeroforma arctica JP610]